ncbi:hypothetical protein Rsub_11531 [Raphidocelis subcapitata]|uniref:EGF-like domain-containing protein n=1 Tax=Raphidocelis subcapitata TaxID=307507 RepID=A0A2V0PLH2_9CHLO|nr:hypothetical protein Rsub_11531 [Raphidocelis subcapitata]|eukprot:GBF98893.1 hypothetical protein Rsub_11531 [Raphidocelis subcapitata]
MAKRSVFLLVSAALVAAVSGADIPEWASPRRSLLARQPCDFPVSVASPITSYNLTFKGTQNGGTRACWTVSVNNDNCVQGADRCCLKGALKTPTLKRLIVFPPSGSTCAQKSTRKFVTYNVAGGRFRKTKVDGVRVLIPLNKLKRVGGEVCVDFAAAGGIPGCNGFDKLCSSSGCRALLWTRKFKRQAGEKKNFCCVSFNANSGGGSLCTPGFYPDSSGSCAVCGIGFYCPNGADRIPCGPGKTTTTTTATDAAQCVPTCTRDADCGTGAACVGGTCSACKPGYYPSATAASGCAECGFNCGTGAACVGGTCSACKPGYYPSATAASGCAECGFSYYCPNGKDRNPCGAGKTTTTTTATDAAQCVPTCTRDADCGTGTACVGGTCSACKPGYYPSATAASGCAECGFSYYCPNGKDRNPCGAGKTTTTTTATDAAQCVPTCTGDADCPTGVACVSNSCNGCRPGYYPSATAASGCAECGYSYYCPNGDDRKPCGAGKTTPTTTSTSASDCVPGCKTDADCTAPDLCNTFDGTCVNCAPRSTYIYGIEGDGIVYEANTNAGASGYHPVFDTGLGAGIYPASAYDPDRQQLLFLALNTRDLYYWQRGAGAVTKIASASQIGINISPVSNFAYYDNALWFANETATVFTSQALVRVPLTYASSGLPTTGTPQTWTLDFVDGSGAPVFVPDSFGDIAINNAGKIYFNTIRLPPPSQYPLGAYFYSLPISSLGAPGSKVNIKLISTTAEPLQISFNCDGTTLWGQRWDTCEWFTINTATGEATKKFSNGHSQCLRDLGGAACTCAASV